MNAAWHGAAFGRTKRMPPLSAVLQEKNVGAYKSNDEMLVMLRQATKHGAKLKFRKVSD